MPPLLEAEGLVLDREPAGERHLRLRLLSPTLGLVYALVRESRPAGGNSSTTRKRTGAAQRPDVFDHAALQLQPPGAGAAHANVYFVSEYKVLRRHAGLGRNYASLAAAAALAALIARNAAHFETCAPVFALCRKALEALDQGAPPEVVRLKALFLLARAEGYAAKEHWLPTLPEADAALALAILNRPAAEAAALVTRDASRLPKLREAFERWLGEHTDIEVK